MRNRNLFFFVIGLISATALAQNTISRASQIERDILTTQDTDMEVLSKGRKLLLNCIVQDSIQKAFEVMKYLDTRFQSTRVMPFWPKEREIISLWIRQYNYLLNTANLEPVQDDGFRQMIVPPRDLLANELQQKAVRERTKLISGILNSNLSDEEKRFLELEVAVWIVNRTDQEQSRDSLNTLSDMYLSEFPGSQYNIYIRKYIRQVYKSSDWSYGLDLSFGYGSLQGKLSDLFDDYMPFAFGLETSYRQFVFYARGSLGSGSSVRRSFSHFGNWTQGLKIEVMMPELSLGYLLVEDRNFRLAPFIGMSGVLIDPPKDERDKPGNNVELNSNASLIYGLNFDYRIGSIFHFLNFIERGDWVIKFRISMITPSYTETNAGFSGSALLITIGIGGIGRLINRDE